MEREEFKQEQRGLEEHLDGEVEREERYESQVRLLRCVAKVVNDDPD